MMTSRKHWILALPIAISAGQTQAQANPADALDAAWIAVCAGATTGSSFFERCQEILNAGPGSGGRRSQAATGNNPGTIAASTRQAIVGQSGDEAAIQRIEQGAWGWFGGVRVGRTDRDGSDLEAGFKTDLWGLLFGVDRQFGAGGRVGLAFSYTDEDGDFRNAAGSLDRSGWALRLLASRPVNERLYLDAYLGYADDDYALNREVSYALTLNEGTPQQSTATVRGRALGDTSGDAFLYGAGFSYALVASEWNLNLGGGIQGVDGSIDAYTEREGAGLALRVASRDLESLQWRLGLDLSRAISTGSGVFMPYGSLYLVGETEDDADRLRVSFAGDASATAIDFARQRPDRNWADFALGVTGNIGQGRQLHLGFRKRLAHDYIDEHNLEFGFRGEW